MTIDFLEAVCDRLIVASDGEDALEKYKEYKPDLIVTDILMPKMNGIDMVKAAKEDNYAQPVIFTTAHTENE